MLLFVAIFTPFQIKKLVPEQYPQPDLYTFFFRNQAVQMKFWKKIDIHILFLIYNHKTTGFLYKQSKTIISISFFGMNS